MFCHFVLYTKVTQSYIYVYSFLGGPHSQHMEVSQLGIESELQLPAYTIGTATQYPSCVCDLHLSSLAHWERSEIEPASSWLLVRFINHWAMMGTPIFADSLNSSHLPKEVLSKDTLNLPLLHSIPQNNESKATSRSQMYGLFINLCRKGHTGQPPGTSSYSLVQLRGAQRAASKPTRWKHTCKSCFSCRIAWHIYMQFHHRVQEQFY